MTLNSGQPDFQPNEPGHVIAAAMPMMATTHVNMIVDALREAGCLRTSTCDFPPVPEGCIATGDLRVTGYIDPRESTDAGTNERYDIAVPDGTDIRGMLGLLLIASDDILDRRRQLPPPPS